MNQQNESALVRRSPDEAQVVPIYNEDPSANWMDVKRFEHIQRVAKIFAESQLVPQQYRGKMADCIIGVQMAMRLQVDPFMFLQNTYVVHGRPGMEAKLAIALVNTRGPFEGPIDWRFEGEPKTDAWTCTAYAQHKVTGRPVEEELSWETVKAEGWLAKDGSKWRTMPVRMFKYRTAMNLARSYCPEVLMGMYSADELEDMGPRIITVEASTPPPADPDAFAEKPGADAAQSEAKQAPHGENADAPNPNPTPADEAQGEAPRAAASNPSPEEAKAPPRRRRRAAETTETPSEPATSEPAPSEGPPAASEESSRAPQKVKISTNAKPPADWVEELQIEGFRGNLTGTTWIAPYSEDTKRLAEIAQREPWCEEVRFE